MSFSSIVSSSAFTSFKPRSIARLHTLNPIYRNNFNTANAVGSRINRFLIPKNNSIILPSSTTLVHRSHDKTNNAFPDTASNYNASDVERYTDQFEGTLKRMVWYF